MEGSAFMITAAGSGSGKTVLTCALLSALRQRGLKVAACKCGPDYIDPMFHREVLGIESENLDLFLCREDVLKELFNAHTSQADVTVIEGVMGYYDGLELSSEKASSYDVARTLKLPAILTVPCKGMALSVVPVILGMIAFREDSAIKGIVLNGISGSLYPRMKVMIESELAKRGCHISVVGYVPKDEVFSLESRHLGLVTPQELGCIKEQLQKAGEIVSETIDLDLLLQIGRKTAWNICTEEAVPAKVKIAVARDEAFCFYYKDNLNLLEKLGCQLISFSPLHSQELPEGVQGIILGGGYPELYAQTLSGNIQMRGAIQEALAKGMPCLAECGGFMYLHEEMEGKDGIMYPMAGVIKGKCIRTPKLVRFGYIEVHPQKTGGLLEAGETLKGHEFHYWDSTDKGRDCQAVKPDKKRSWECIHMKDGLFAGFPHVHFYSNPAFARRFVERCGQFGGLKNMRRHEAGQNNGK